MGIRQSIANAILGDERTRLEDGLRVLEEAYQRGPYIVTPDMLAEQLRETESTQLLDLVSRLQGEYTLLLGGVSGNEQARLRAVSESRNLWKWDVLTQAIINLWTNFGFGSTISITPKDDELTPYWDAFWFADENQNILADDKIARQSDWTLTDGEIYYVYFVSMLDGFPIVRIIKTDQIVEIISDPDDELTPLYYKRQWKRLGETGEMEVAYYPDVLASMNGWLDRVELPGDAQLAQNMRDNTVIMMQQSAFNCKDGLRGWPLFTAGAVWSRAHTKFREDRASVASSVAMYVNKLKLSSGGQRAVDAIKTKLQSTLATSGYGTETNPPPARGATWIQNQSADLERMPLTTGAGDAKMDGEGLLQMAALGGGVFPHYVGSGDAYRLACYSDDTEVLTECGWKSWRAWQLGEKIATYNPSTKRIEYRVPTELHTYYYQGKMVHISNKSVDALVTPNHRMLAQAAHKFNNGQDFEVMRADELPKRAVLPAESYIEDRPDIDTFIVPGHIYYCGDKHSKRVVEPVEYHMDDWLEFVGWYVSEGCLHKSGNSFVIEICQNANSPYVPELNRLLRGRMGFSCQSSKEDTYLTWRKTSKSMYKLLKQNCGAGCENKHLPSFVFDLNIRQTNILLDALWKGDGHFAKGKKRYYGCYTSVSKQLIDEVSILILHAGQWPKVKLLTEANQHPRHKQNLAVYRCNRAERFCGIQTDNRLEHVTMEDYSGIVWCFEAPPNKMFITRRNGSPLIAGNTSTAMEVPLMRQWSRYQQFWGEQFRMMLRVVAWAAVEYGGATEFETLECDINTDRLIDDDLSALSEALGNILREGLIPFANIVPEEMTLEVLRIVWTNILSALGVADIQDVLRDEWFVPQEEEVTPTPVVVTIPDSGNGQEPPIPAQELHEVHLRESHAGQRVRLNCPFPDCDSEYVLAFADHKGLMVCEKCSRTFDPQLERNGVRQ